MFNSNEHLTADMIREWMGIFDGIKSVAKYAGTSLATLAVEDIPSSANCSSPWTVF